MEVVRFYGPRCFNIICLHLLYCLRADNSLSRLIPSFPALILTVYYESNFLCFADFVLVNRTVCLYLAFCEVYMYAHTIM